MTTQEQQMLQGLTDRINQTQLAEKDTDAEQMLQQTLGRNPDALYILTQTVLVQRYALDQAQKQLADQKSQMEQMQRQISAPAAEPKHVTSFLGNLLGLKNEEPARQAAPPPPPPSGPAYMPVPAYAQPAYTPMPGYASGPAFGQPASMYGAAPQGGFLRSAMQTAAGVAAGALAFEGIEGLMHGFGHAAGYGSGFGNGGGFGTAGRPEEVINNYYGDAVPGAEHAAHTEHSDYFSSGANTVTAEPTHTDASQVYSSPGLKDAVYNTPDAGNDFTAPSYNSGLNDADSGTLQATDDDFTADNSSSFDDGSSSATDFDAGGDSGGDSDSGGGDDSSNF